MAGATNGRTLLLAEDDIEVCHYLRAALDCQGYSVEIVHDGEEAVNCFRGQRSSISAILMDVIMPRKDGIEALKEIRQFDQHTPVIMMSGASSALNVVTAMTNGANDFISKPIDPAHLRKAMNKAFESHIAPPPMMAGLTASSTKDPFFLSASPRMRELQNLVASVGWSEVPVLIRGETGVGKEVFVRQLHARSPRAKKPVLKLNCAALPSELVESELFGYERGAFTGAFQKKPGMFELADGGTILLDEIGDMDFKLQAKLLQVLQDQEFQRIGGKDTVKVNVRIMAATHRDLEEAIVERQFREDLYYRLNVIGFQLPALRERQEDIIPMAEFFIAKYTTPGVNPIKIPPILRDAFLEYHWPGNIRQLENVVRKFIILRDASSIEQDLRRLMAKKHSDGPVRLDGPSIVSRMQADVLAIQPSATSDQRSARPQFDIADKVDGSTDCATPVLVQVANAKREAERSAILAALKSTNWNRRRAAAIMQIDYKALLYKMKVLAVRKEGLAETGT